MTDAALKDKIKQALENLKLWLGREPDANDTAQALEAIAFMEKLPLDRVTCAHSEILATQWGK